MVGILINSKPLVLPDTLLRAEALLEAFNPGMEGGRAIMEILMGKVNPSGKLPISFPRHAGQLPVYYNAVRGQHGDRYADLTQESAFAFGYGLSYTEFSFRAPQLSASAIPLDGEVTVSVTVVNRGDRRGTTVVQLYVEDVVTSATWAGRELKGWERIDLDPGEERIVKLQLKAEDLWILDREGAKRVEPGLFRILTGSSSRTCDLQAAELTLLAK